MRSEEPWRSVRDKEISSLVSYRPMSRKFNLQMKKNSGNPGNFSVFKKHHQRNQKGVLSKQNNVWNIPPKLQCQRQLTTAALLSLTSVQYNVPLGRKKNSVNTQSRLFCSSAPARNSDLCLVILTEFYLVYFSPSASRPCVIACLRLEMGHPSYWTHLGHYIQCSFTYAIHNINIPMISCSHLAEMTLVPQPHEAPDGKNTFWDNSACKVPFLFAVWNRYYTLSHCLEKLFFF